MYGVCTQLKFLGQSSPLLGLLCGPLWEQRPSQLENEPFTPLGEVSLICPKQQSRPFCPCLASIKLFPVSW